MLRVSNLGKAFADRVILESVSFTLAAGDRVGIVGPNGCGKSTMLAMLAGALAPDTGSVTLDPGLRLGYLRQGYLGDEALPVVNLLEPSGGALTAQSAMSCAGEALSANPQSPEALERYEHAAEDFDRAGGYGVLAQIEETLRDLALDAIDLDRPAGTLSGGQKTRVALASLLIQTPDVLLLDEPTNHLDVDGLRALEGFLQRFRGAALVVSHDRAFLDAAVTAILEIRDTTHAAVLYTGNYSAYAEAKRHEVEAQWEQYMQQQRERTRIEAEVHALKEGARYTERRTSDTYDHGDTRGKKMASKQRAAKAARTAVVRERKLERSLAEHPAEKPKAGWKLKLAFAPVEGGAREVVRIEQVSRSYGERAVLSEINLLVRHGERVAITGPNGGGKTTLLRIIAGSLTAEHGTVRLGAGIIPGYFSQEQELLDLRRSPLELLRSMQAMDETAARSLLHAYLFSGDMVFTPVGRLSYGERARLALALLVADRANLLLLDEPTNHLDIPSRERFEEALATFPGTIILVMHDRYAISRLATRVLELRDGTLQEVDVETESHIAV